MESGMTKVQDGKISKNWQDMLDVVKKTVTPEGTDDKEFQMFVYQAQKTGLDPLARQIYMTKIKGKATIQATIDGFRLVAERSKVYEGQAQTLWCGENGQWVDIWLSKSAPAAAKAGVYRKGFREALWATAKYDEYCQKKDGRPTFMWGKMPALMLAKCAEMLALRKAFPQDLSGVYGKEEMDQAEPVVPRGVQNAEVVEGEEVKETSPKSSSEVLQAHGYTRKAKAGSCSGCDGFGVIPVMDGNSDNLSGTAECKKCGNTGVEFVEEKKEEIDPLSVEDLGKYLDACKTDGEVKEVWETFKLGKPDSKSQAAGFKLWKKTLRRIEGGK